MIINALKFFLGPLLVIILLSIYVSYPSFNLALFGDDWQQIWKYFQLVGPKSSIINHLTFFISGYGSFDVMTGLLYNSFGQNYQVYYLFAYVYKLIAALSIWPLVFYLTRSKLAAFYASLFVSVTIIGLESTNWVFNSPAYLAVANLSLFLYFFIKSRENLALKYFVTAVLFFYLAHIFALVRTSGLLPFAIILELFLNFKSPNIKLSLRRIFFIVTTFIFITLTSPASEGAGSLIGGSSTIINDGLSSISALFKQGRTDFLFYPIMTFGRLLLPNTINFQLFELLLTVIIFIIILSLNISKGKKISCVIMVTFVLWSIVSWLVLSFNKATLSINDTLSLAIGGYLIASGIILLYFNWKSPFSILFFIGIFWTLFSFIFPWVRAPETLHPTEHRYFITTVIGIAVLLASIIGLGKKLKNRIYLSLLIIPLVLMNIITSRNYFIDVMENSHGREAMNKIWSQLPYYPQMGKTEKPLIFYFESSPNKERLRHHSLTFGFPFKIATLYNIYDDNLTKSYTRFPIATNDWSEIVSIVSKEDYLVKYDLSKGIIPIDNIYAFYLDENNNLINITQQTREKLREILSKP